MGDDNYFIKLYVFYNPVLASSLIFIKQLKYNIEMKKTILALGLMGLITVSCKNSADKNASIKSETTSEIPADKNEVPDMHTSQISLDWEGTYEGTLPCASCEGIHTKITLTADGSYKSELEYLGKEDGKFTDNGKFTWNEDGNTITLLEVNGETKHYKVVENAIIMLDKDGKVNTGYLASHYVLSKQ